MKSRYRVFLFCFLAFCCIGCDRISKDLAREHLMHRAPVSFFHDTLRLEYVENTGAFLSLGSDLPEPAGFWVFGMAPLVFLAFVFGYAVYNCRKMSDAMLFSVGLVFSGGMGNVIDRIQNHRHVTDFMNIGLDGLRTGIFNLADVYVSMGVVLFLFVYRKS